MTVEYGSNKGEGIKDDDRWPPKVPKRIVGINYKGQSFDQNEIRRLCKEKQWYCNLLT